MPFASEGLGGPFGRGRVGGLDSRPISTGMTTLSPGLRGAGDAFAGLPAGPLPGFPPALPLPAGLPAGFVAALPSPGAVVGLPVLPLPLGATFPSALAFAASAVET